jgi:AcrR family transcriptional regulator
MRQSEVSRSTRGGPVIPARVAAEGSRARLLTTATELFAARGYHGVSVRDIASAMGVKPSSLYAHYSSKDELFCYLVRLANEEIDLRLREAILSARPDPVDTLSALMRAYAEFHAEFPLLGTIGHNDLHALSPASLDQVTQLRKQHIDLFLSVIARGNDSGVFSCPRPWLAVAAIAGMGIRIALWYRTPNQPMEPSVDSYAAAMQQWMPTVTVAELADEYVDYALSLVHTRPDARPRGAVVAPARPRR